jgi:hypothetical protein
VTGAAGHEHGRRAEIEPGAVAPDERPSSGGNGDHADGNPRGNVLAEEHGREQRGEDALEIQKERRFRGGPAREGRHQQDGANHAAGEDGTGEPRQIAPGEGRLPRDGAAKSPRARSSIPNPRPDPR